MQWRVAGLVGQAPANRDRPPREAREPRRQRCGRNPRLACPPPKIKRLRVVVPLPRQRLAALAGLLACGGGENGFSLQRSRVIHARREIGIREGSLSKLPRAIGSPRKHFRIGPLQHQVIARSSVIVGDKAIHLSAIGHSDELTMGKVQEASRNEPETGVSRHGELCSGRCCKAKREVDPLVRGAVGGCRGGNARRAREVCEQIRLPGQGDGIGFGGGPVLGGESVQMAEGLKTVRV